MAHLDMAINMVFMGVFSKYSKNADHLQLLNNYLLHQSSTFHFTQFSSSIKMLENHYAVPPHWGEDRDPALTSAGDDLEELVMVGTSMKEPACENQWCGLKDSVKWNGPGIEGGVITLGWSKEDSEL